MIVQLFESFAKEWLLSTSRSYRTLIYGSEVALGSIIALIAITEFPIFSPILIFYPLWTGVKFYNLENESYAKQGKHWFPLRKHIILYWVYLVFAIPIVLAIFFGMLYLFITFILYMIDGASFNFSFSEVVVTIIFISIFALALFGVAAWLYDTPKVIRKLIKGQWPKDVL